MSTDQEAVSTERGEVPEAFDAVAERYDLMVALNPGYHAHLRRSARLLVSSVADRDQERPLRLVDLGCGSGASTRALLEELRRAGIDADVVGVDGSAGMLAQARSKQWPASVRFVQGRAEALESVCREVGIDAPDGVFAAYLLRNVPDRDGLLRSLHALIRPGGALVVHEYSVAGRPSAEAVWTAICRGVVVPLGWLTSRQTRLYRYLWRSVLDMDSVGVVLGRMADAGFEDTASHTVRGWQRGIVHTFYGRRPA